MVPQVLYVRDGLPPGVIVSLAPSVPSRWVSLVHTYSTYPTSERR